MARKVGRPTKITPEHIDTARQLLGRVLYPSKVAQKLHEKYKFSLTIAYEVIERARQEVIDSFKAAGTTKDPLLAICLSLEEIIADPKSSRTERIAASGQLIKLLNLDRYLQKLDTVGVEGFLASVMNRKAQLAALGGDHAAAS